MDNENKYDQGNEFQPNGPQMTFDELRQEEVFQVEPPKAKGRAKKWIPLLLVLLLVIGGAGYYVAASGMFLKDSDKLGRAIKNTFKADEFGEAFLSLGNIKTEECGVSCKITAEGVVVELDCDTDLNAYHSSLAANVKYEGVNLTVKGELDKKNVKLQIPEASNKVYTYNYWDKKTGAIVELLTQAGVSADSIDEYLQELSKKKPTDEFAAEITERFNHSVKDLKVTKIDKESYVVSDKKRSCDGYEVVVTKEDMKRLCGDFLEVFCKYAEQQSVLKRYMDTDESMEELEEALEDMKELKLYFYVYHSKLAAIKILDPTGEGSDVLVEFLDGEDPMSSINLSVTGELATLRRTVTKDGDMEKAVYTVAGMEVLTREYNTKTGAFKISAGYDEDKVEFSGMVKTSKDETTVRLEFDEETTGLKGFSMEVTVRRKAKVESLSGEEVDLGTLDITSLSDEITELGEYFESMDIGASDY